MECDDPARTMHAGTTRNGERALVLLRKILPFFAPYRGRLAAIFGLAIATAGISALEPWVLKILFDAFSEHHPARAIGLLLVLLVIMLLARETLSGLLDWLIWRVRIGANYRMLQATVDRLHALPLEYHRGESVGATMTRVERGVSGSVTAFSDVAFHLLPSLVYLVVSAAVMVRLEWRLALVVVVFAPLPAILGARASGEQVTRERDLMDRWTKVFSRFNEVLSGMLVVKSFVMEEEEKRRFLRGVGDANDVVVRGVATDARVNATKNAAMAAARVAAIAFGGYLVLEAKIPLGTLVAFLAYTAGVFHPVQAVTGMYQTLRRGTVALETVFSILDAQDSLGDAVDARDPGVLRGDIEFRDVSFAYRAGAPVVRGLSLRVGAGETVALVGPSGAGKTTLMVLLQRLYDPTGGAILVDGHDLRALKQRAVRGQMGVVLQEGLLFSDTVRDNIRFGSPDATDEAIALAARAANAHDFIAKLPDGYETLVGERGCKLSGGERQRVAIARALLKDPPILILDEATSALDAESEAEVQEALARLMRGRTTIVIAHRLATITRADRILVFAQGVVQESGSHAELLRANGYYASLVRRQVAGLLPEAA